jgi:hypothetical protein
MSYRDFFVIFLLIILISTLSNFSAEAMQKSPNARPIIAKKQTQELKIQLMKLERDIRTYPEKTLRNPSVKPNNQRQKVRFLSRLRDIENQISKLNNPKSQVLNLKVHSLRQEVRKLENAVHKVTLREKFRVYRKQRGSKPTPSCDVIASTISGSVVDSVSDAPIPNREVDIYDSGGSWISYGYTDSNGNYAVSGLSNGTYYVETYGSDNYIDELYDNVVCEPYCDPTTGTPIVLNGSASADFALDPGGSISGTVTDSTTSAPIEGASISIYDTNGSNVAYGYSDSSGNYTITGPLVGDYYAKSYNYNDYIDEVYDDHICEPNCNPLIGDAFAVSSGQNTSGIDFALSLGGTISGTITDSVTSNPVESDLYVYDTSGNIVAYGFTDGSGNYQIGGLLTGTYFVLTSNYWGYIDELYDNIQCFKGNCDPTTGKSISVTQGSTTPGIDFALDAGGSFSGQVKGDGNPIPYSSVNVYDSEGFYVAYGYADDSGNYSVPGLISGSYYSTAYNYYGFVEELYDDIPCQTGCDVTQGTPISVTVGSDTPGINFDLNQGGKISGKVTDESTSNPIPSGVLIYDAQGIFTSYAYSDESGNYITDKGLADGNYYAISYNYYGYMDELYDNIPCAFSKCDPLGGTKIAVTSGNTTPNVDFELNTGGRIIGNVSSTLGSPITGFSVNLFSSTGTYLTSGYPIDGLGNYEVTGIPTGNYYISTYNYEFYADEVYNNHPCTGGFCDVTIAGDLVPVVVGSTTPGRDFALDEGGSLSGNISDAHTGQSVQYAEVDIYDSSGTWVSYGYTDESGDYSSTYNYIGLAAGDYYVITNTYSGYRDELYDDVSCPAGICDFSSGNPVPVTTRQDTPGIDFSLNSCDAYIYIKPYDLPAGTVGAPYTKTLSAFGGTAPYQFLVKYGNLPPGFTLDSATGVLSGTATNPGQNNFAIAAVDNNGCAGLQGYALNFYLPNSLFFDDFESGSLPTGWTFLKGTWTESGGALHGTHDRKTYAIASPAFPGCSDCSVEAQVETAGGNSGSRVSLLGWWIDKKNFVEVMFKEAQDRVVLKVRINGSVVAKAKAIVSIDPNQTYDVKVEYQNSAYHVFIDGVEQITLTAPPPVSGTVGFLVKGTTGTFGMIEVD